MQRLNSRLEREVPNWEGSMAVRRDDCNLARRRVRGDRGLRQQQTKLNDCPEGEHGGSKIRPPVVRFSQPATYSRQ